MPVVTCGTGLSPAARHSDVLCLSVPCSRWDADSQPPGLEKRNIYGFSPPVGGILLEQPELRHSYGKETRWPFSPLGKCHWEDMLPVFRPRWPVGFSQHPKLLPLTGNIYPSHPHGSFPPPSGLCSGAPDRSGTPVFPITWTALPALPCFEAHWPLTRPVFVYSYVISPPHGQEMPVTEQFAVFVARVPTGA